MDIQEKLLGFFGPELYKINIQSLDVKKEAKSLTVRPILYIMRHIWDLDEKKVREFKCRRDCPLWPTKTDYFNNSFLCDQGPLSGS